MAQAAEQHLSPCGVALKSQDWSKVVVIATWSPARCEFPAGRLPAIGI